jgi:hypothetical protein
MRTNQDVIAVVTGVNRGIGLRLSASWRTEALP